jgi:hypothetical protein
MYTGHDYLAEAARSAEILGVDFSKEKFNIHDFARGIKVEYEHGLVSDLTDVTHDDMVSTAKIALAHLYEDDRAHYDYYDGLRIMEHAPEGYWRGTDPNTYWQNKKIGYYILIVLILIVIIILIRDPRPIYGFIAVCIGYLIWIYK